MNNNILYLSVLLLAFNFTFSQEEEVEEISNIQEYTPSKLLNKGQWDIKFFNNLYTETEGTLTEGKDPRSTFFTSTIETFTGVSENNRINLGLIVEMRSNVTSDRDALDVFKFDGESGSARSGITSIAPAIKFSPIKSVSNFSVQSAFHIPLVSEESDDKGVYLDQKGFILQNKFFYDYTFSGDKFQLFTELNTEFNFGKEEDSFANNSLIVAPGVFLSYFPSNKFTILALVQHSQRIDLGNKFSQDYTAVGGGAKYQLSNVINLEALYTKFVRGNDTGLGQSFNLGIRALF